MTRLIGLILILALPLPLHAEDQEAVQKELKALQGTWKAVALEAGGRQFPKESIPAFTFIVKTDGKSLAKMPQGEYQTTIVVDPSKDPKTIDNHHESGPQQGQKQYGIYKLEGDKWTVCMSRPGVEESERPKSFATKDTTNVIFVFERQKEDK